MDIYTSRAGCISDRYKQGNIIALVVVVTATVIVPIVSTIATNTISIITIAIAMSQCHHHLCHLIEGLKGRGVEA